jgi:hypothetical protein
MQNENKSFFDWTFFILLTSLLVSCSHQKVGNPQIDEVSTRYEILDVVKFLSSDNLKGRSALRSEINIAATFISEEFKKQKLLKFPKDSNYYQCFTHEGKEIKNVIGYIKGIDPKQNDEVIILSAHYDHLGVTQNGNDSIYNGARDNAVGIAAIINAAKYFSKYPPNRSMIFVAFTGEEIGYVGSRYFSENPPVPLNKIVFDLNADNAGYNDTTITTIVGLGRTSAEPDIKEANRQYGLTAEPDPVPEMNLFERSDNYSLAVKGIPGVTYAMGFTSFDTLLTNYYHTVDDELETLDLDYSLRYINSYILAAKLIDANFSAPYWK